jgi:hypothetical protein
MWCYFTLQLKVRNEMKYKTQEETVAVRRTERSFFRQAW